MSKIQKYKKETETKDQYVPVPVWFTKQTSNKKFVTYLTIFEKELFCFIHGLSSNGSCFATDDYFAKIYNVTIKHVNSTIQKLCDRELIFISHENNNRIIKSVELNNLKDRVLIKITNGKYIISNGYKQMECDPIELENEPENENLLREYFYNEPTGT